MNYELELADDIEVQDRPVEVSDDALAVFMIGHSKHPWEHFAGLLTLHGIKLLVDVRTSPFSRFAPHFSQKRLVPLLESIGIAYHHEPRLGGKPPLPLSEQRALIEQSGPLTPGTCFMCSEGNFRECHRHYTLAPIFLELGVPVLQILPDGQIHRDTGPTLDTLHKMRAYLPVP